MNLIVCPTLGCNFACDYCFQGADKPFNTMSEAVMDGIVNLFQKTLNKRPDLQHVQFVWYGGEPLMGKQIIYDLADRLIAICNKSKITYSAMMVSNGFLMKKDVAKELAARGLNLVQITLDGSEEHHDVRRHLLSKKGTYQKIGNVEEWIDEIPITVNIRVNIDERNKEDIRNLIDDLETRGLSGKQNFRMYFSPVESMTLGCHNVSEKMMQKMNYGQLEASLYRYAFKKNLTDLPYPMRFMGICSAIRPYDYIVVPNGDIHKCWDTV